MSRTSKQILHDRAMKVAMNYLNSHGHKVEKMKETNSSFDLLVDKNLRCEVKSAESLQQNMGYATWRFNLHRHGILQENQADLYWLYIYGIPGFKKGISLVLPHSEVEGKTNLSITSRSLLTHWAKWYMRMDLFEKKS